MKKKIIVISLISTLLISAVVLVVIHFSVKSKSNQVVEDLVNDNINIMYEIDNFTDCLIVSSIIEKGEKVTFDKVHEMKNQYYIFPKGVIKYKLIDSKSYKCTLWEYHDISEKCYVHDWKDVFKSRNEMIKTFIDMRKDEDGFIVDTKKNEQIIYKQNTKAKRFTYRVETRLASYKTEICFVKDRDKWLVAEIYSEII